jgi:signal transduction histidine kinase/DNA-binding response OmpR family regulator
METIWTSFQYILASSPYMAHGHCYLWQTPLVGLHIVSDGFIAIAYFSIPAMLIYFVSKRNDVPFSKVFVLFGAFIILCGTGHLLDIWTLWHPDYWVSGIEKAITALVSCYTALSLVELLPQFLALQTPEQLQIINQELEKQIAERQKTEETLQTIITGTASVTGDEFFPVLVEKLATALGVAHAIVFETVDNSLQKLRSINIWSVDHLAENFEYKLVNTPCKDVVEKNILCAYPSGLQEIFPGNTLIEQLGAESYIGVPLVDIKQNVIGNLCIVDVKPLLANDRTQALLKVFAARASAEIQRKWAEKEKHQAYQQLEFRVEERTSELVKANHALEGEVRERTAAEKAMRIMAEKEKAINDELKLAKEAADAANRAKSEFLANMSHELRTPLNAILGFTQLMQQDQSLTIDHQKYIEIINHSGEHLLALINDVLEMSKIETGRTALYETDFDLYKLLSSLEAMFQLKGQSKGLQLIFDYDVALPQYIKTDENKLRQVLINLLGNAIKFTEKGSVTLRISNQDQQPFTCKQQTLCFEIEDTGLGIASEEIGNLFQAFQQTTAGHKSQEGTGLGLRISQKFVQLMGGEITVRSQLNQGSCFTFDIQVALVDMVASVSSFSPQGRMSLDIGQEYRILIAEDNHLNSLLLTKILNNLGFTVREAENGEKAIAIWEQWQPHLIFMDMQMPILNGYAATKQIRTREQELASTQIIAPTKIIALTASAFTEQRQETLDAGCDDFVSKPFRWEEIVETLSQHLQIEYLHESTSENTNAPYSGTYDSNAILNKEDIAIMPVEWTHELSAAAAQGNDLKCIDLITQIPSQQTSLIMNLTKLVESYQFDKLMLLIQTKE